MYISPSYPFSGSHLISLCSVHMCLYSCKSVNVDVRAHSHMYVCLWIQPSVIADISVSMDSSGCRDYHQSNCWGWQDTHTHMHTHTHTRTHAHTHALTMSPVLVELISLPRCFLPHRALFPLPHPSAQP